MNFGFTKSKVDSNLYNKVVNDGIMILLVYVDDIFFTGEEKLISECKKKLVVEFEMKYLGTIHYFLGKYIVEILKRFGMLDCKEMNTPMVTNLTFLNDDSSDTVDITLYQHIIISLVHLTNTRLDICFVVNTLG